MPVELDDSSTVSGDASVSSSTGNQNQNPTPQSVVKKKRNLPGMPDPDAEVIALSPKTLMATNRFVCEICSKGFQRDQNLQLHRRGHNLPWKLRQRTSKEVRKKVYVCPVSGCVHHDPSRALGDLTGIKKHFCRKHGEKRYKCEKCSKSYAVQSDWKAHSKICGTKEYRCDCGILFSRRDSFITHRAFCDVLAEESAKKNHTQSKRLYTETVISKNVSESEHKSPADVVSPPPPSPLSVAPAVSAETEPEHEPEPANIISSSVLPIRDSSDDTENNTLEVIMEEEAPRTIGLNGSNDDSNNNKTVYAGLFASSSTASPSLYAASSTHSPSLFPPSSSMEPISLCLSTTSPCLFGATLQDPPPHFLTPPPQPAISATALLQKAAQMGSTSSGGSLLRGLGIVSTTSSPMELSSHDAGFGLGLGLPCSSGTGLKELMMGNSSVFDPKQTTLDFLGLGRAVGNNNPGGGLSSALWGAGMDVFGSGKDIGRRSS
ncbi:unnamed protein product [Eruca vesicaria subsp. sativa]|uniref:C2H2-type domain-containing protein n=1 Tax=Eruca vesicaria subsp. sativa TaxID=29727 RepID=A0ABC8K7K0_ERUVS|nr:unnamed protein product [Eruca vesicaria subsp. sativa]